MNKEVFRMTLPISEKIIDELNRFFNLKIKDELTYNLKNNIKINGIEYTIVSNFNCILIQEFHTVCNISIEIFKEGNSILKRLKLAHSLLDVFSIIDIENNEKESFLIKFEEITNDKSKVFNRTYDCLRKRICQDEESILNQLLYKSFADKLQGMELCFVLLCEPLYINDHKNSNHKLIQAKLEFLGYDEFYYKQYKLLPNVCSNNVYLNTLYIILKCIYDGETIEKSLGKATAVDRLYSFANHLVDEGYFD